MPLPSKTGNASVDSSITRNEAGIPALVRAVGRPLEVGGSDEEHVAGLDERGQVLVERLTRRLGQPVRQAARVEPVLELALPVVISVRHRHPHSLQSEPW